PRPASTGTGPPGPTSQPGPPPDRWQAGPATAAESSPEWGMASSAHIDLPPAAPEPAHGAPLPRIPEIPAAAPEPEPAPANDREIAALLRQGAEAARRGGPPHTPPPRS